MDRNFSRALDAVLQYEGGFVDHPRDPGGATNLGVTIANFRAYVKPDGTVADLKKLTREQAGVVFRRHYWDEVMGSSLPDGVDLAVFDFAVNSGVGRAARFLQLLVGVTADGKIGPATLKAVAAADKTKLVNDFCDKRQAFLEGLSTFPTFGKGWTSRVKQVRALSLQLAGQEPDAVEVVVKHVETPVDVPVIPKGADKPGVGRWLAAVPLVGTAVTGFGGLDNVTKAIVLGIVFIGVVALLLRGEQIAARAKKLLASFDE